ncbi:hypothetical protein M970_011130 [Encephalitozoon cuniculi EcunIII-L]|nr:hypothetical protein M970_011130 [Encephalitozoon cuniculi EcunIII-L]
MVRRSLYFLAVMGVVRSSSGLYIPSVVLQELGIASSQGCLMIAETNGNFGIVSSGLESPVYITEGPQGHREVSWQPVRGEDRAVPIYAPSAEEVRESISSVRGSEPGQYIAPQPTGFVPASTPVFGTIESASTAGAAVPVEGVFVASTENPASTGSSSTSTCPPKGTAGTTDNKGKAGGAAADDKSKSSSSSSSKKKKGAKSLVALGAVATTALFSIVM